MLNGTLIDLRTIASEEECRLWYDEYSDIGQRAEFDHTEIIPLHKILERFRSNGYWDDEGGTMLIVLDSEKIIGTISFSRVSQFDLELGYRIFKHEHREHGYGSDALSLFCGYLFDSMPVVRLTIKTTPGNIASRRVAEKFGFKQEGVLRKAIFFRGSFHDFLVFSLLREDEVL